MSAEQEAPEFGDLLDMPVGNAPRPSAVPDGTWRLAVKEVDQTIISQKKGTPGVEITFGLVEPQDDVDEEAYEDFAEKYDVKTKTVRETFWKTKDSLYRLGDFLEACGLDVANRSFKQVLAECVGETCLAYLSSSPSKTPGDDRVFTNVKRFVKED